MFKIAYIKLFSYP